MKKGELVILGLGLLGVAYLVYQWLKKAEAEPEVEAKPVELWPFPEFTPEGVRVTKPPYVEWVEEVKPIYAPPEEVWYEEYYQRQREEYPIDPYGRGYP